MLVGGKRGSSATLRLLGEVVVLVSSPGGTLRGARVRGWTEPGVVLAGWGHIQ